MPSIRERLTNALLRPERDKLREAAGIFIEAFERGPSMYPPEMLIQNLAEVDSRLIDLILRQIKERGFFYDYKLTEQDRLRAVTLSRRMYDNDVITEAIIGMWTDFGFGINLDVTPRDRRAEKVWDEFWEADYNQYVFSSRIIQELSTKVLRDGDFLFVFFVSKVDGLVTTRVIETEDIKGGSGGESQDDDGVITLPDDDTVPIYYRREISKVSKDGAPAVLYFRDWRAADDLAGKVKLPDDGVDADLLNESTIVRAMLVAHRPRGQRGWPLMTTGIPWSEAYRSFLQDRAAVTRAVSMFVDKVMVKGGQQAVDQIARRLESALAAGGDSETNPRPVAGSTWLENEASVRERLPLATGAGDAEKDGSMILAQAGLAGRVYPHYLGRGESFRLATASAMETPTERAFNRYQLFWSSVFQDMARFVFQMAERYGKTPKFSTYDVDVSTDTLLTAEPGQVLSAVQGAMEMIDRNLLDELVSARSANQLLRVLLQSVGIGDVADIYQGVPPPQEEPEQPEQPEQMGMRGAWEHIRQAANHINERLAQL